MRITLLIISLFISTSAFSTNSDDLKEFFDKNKIGKGADYGVYKNDNDYIISVHGFYDDLENCLEIIAMLNFKQPNTYSCKPLNH